MGEIKRFMPAVLEENGEVICLECHLGEYVLHTDHLAGVQGLQEQARILRDGLASIRDFDRAYSSMPPEDMRRIARATLAAAEPRP